MFSISFFLFVAFIVVVGFLAVTWKSRNKVPLDSDVADDRNAKRSTRSNGAFNEPSTNDFRGGVLPAENKLSENDYDEQNDVTK
jgi:hypothetical protein